MKAMLRWLTMPVPSSSAITRLRLRATTPPVPIMFCPPGEQRASVAGSALGTSWQQFPCSISPARGWGGSRRPWSHWRRQRVSWPTPNLSGRGAHVLKARECILQMREYHSPLDGSAEDLRLDMNESTTGCSPRVLAKMRSLDARSLARYPSREQGESLVANFLK